MPAQLAAAETNVDDELPDLVVTNLGINSDDTSTGEVIVIRATIANKGNAGAEDIGESIFVDGTLLTSRGEYSLSAGQSIVRELEWEASDGAHAIKWMVDPENRITEHHEENNFRTIEIHVEDDKLPDLTITKVFVDKDVYSPGDLVVIKAEVKNLGNGLAEGIRDVLLVDENIVSDSDAYRLEPGQSVLRQFRWEAVAGTHTLGVAVDPGNRIEELNEGNNGKSVLVEVSRPPAYFEVEVEPQILEIHPGGAASTVVFIVPRNQFSGYVDLKLDTSDHLPISEYVFEPDSISLTNDGARSHLLVRLRDSAESGDYAVKIIAKGGDFTAFGIIKLKVIAPEGKLLVLPLEPANNQVVDELPVTLKVQVLKPDSEAPLQGAKVAFFVKGFEDEWVTRSDSSGYAQITISDIGPGEYGWVARAIKDGFNLGSSRVQAFNVIVDVKKVQVPQLGVPFEGKFTHEDEVHTYAFEFEEGKTYVIRTFELDGVDTVIELLTDQGSRIAGDDDSGEGLASKIIFTARESGVYFLVVRDYWEIGEGSYILLVTETVSATLIVNIEHTYIGDLEIWVGVEGGKEVKIWSRDGGSSDDLIERWNLGTFGFTLEDLSLLGSQVWYLK
ncbi:MAG: CARDB domain-containing protein, partial [Nitrososphaerales archaeon]